MLTAVHLCICVFAVYAQYYSCYWASWPLCNSAPPPDALLPKHSLHFQFIPIVCFFSDLSLSRKGFQGLKYSVLKSSSNSQDDVTFCSDWMLSQRVCQVWDFPPKGIFARQNEPLPLMALFLKSLCRLQRFRNHQGPRRWQQQKINQCIPKEIRDALLRNDFCLFGDWNVQI